MTSGRLPPPSAAAALRMVRDVFGVTLWSKQADVVRAVFGPKRTTAVRSCHAAGKTLTAACVALAWLGTRPYSNVITTAPTHRQVQELLWKEIRRIHRGCKRPFGGHLPPSASSLRIDDGWLALGFASDDPVNVQGWHCQGGTLVILDEAPGVHPDVWAALQGVLTGRHDRLLAIGNPVMPTGPFFDCFSDPDVTKIQISAFDTPNVRAGKEVVPGLVTTEWVEARRRKLGEAHPLWKSRVLGDFPDNADEVLVPLAWVEAAERRWEALNQANGHGWAGPVMLGVDVARFGPDNTVVATATAQGVRGLRKLPKRDVPETAGMVIRMAEEAHAGAVRVDADGLGAGVFDLVRGQLGSDRTVEMRGAMSALDSKRYLNRRAEWFWTLRERLDPSRPDALALPPDENLRSQLTGMRWSVTPKGQTRVESKDDMRARGMDSPDEADAVAYATACLDPLVISVSFDPDIGRGVNHWAF